METPRTSVWACLPAVLSRGRWSLFLVLALLVLTMSPAWADCAPDASERDAAFPSAIEVSALIGSGRIICKELVFQGELQADTGRAFEPVLRFRDGAGRHYLVLPRANSAGRFVRSLVYGVELRFLGRTPGGLPLAVQGTAEPRRPYEGDIRESDPRLDEIKQKLRRGEAPPGEIRLRYGGTRGDHAMFYDLVGRQLYFRYREDRFDRRGDRKVKGLIEGQAYLVSGAYRGARLGEVVSPPGSPNYNSLLENEDSTLEYDFGAAVPLRMEQILFR